VILSSKNRNFFSFFSENKNGGNMPKKHDDTEKTEIVRVRMSFEERERCNKARLAGSHHMDAESSFMGFLVDLGLKKYEKALLPLEMAEDETPATLIKKKKVS
jgi:hypothetical protein